MRNDLAVFILTHGRANEQKTLETLSKSGYSGKVYLVIDDEDAQKELYEQLYGEQILIFSKREIEPRCDTFTNQEEWRTVMYARNKTYELARDLGLRYVLVCDDDITRFTFRYEDGGSLRGASITDFDSLLDKMADCMEAGHISIFGFSQSGAFFGGLGSDKWKKGCQRTCSQAMMIDAEDQLPWRCIFGEDLHVSLDAGNMGKTVLSTMMVSIESPERTTNKGGLHDLYASSNMYTTFFYSVIAFPSIVKLYWSKGEVKLRIRQDGVAPMILSSKYKRGST